MNSKSLVLLIISCFYFAIQAQNKDSIKLKRVYPECFFDNVNWDFSVTHKTTRLISESSCIKGLYILMPTDIYYFPNIDSSFSLPYYSHERISLRRKYNYSWDYTFHIKCISTNKKYHQLLDLDKPLRSTSDLFQFVYGHRLEARDQKQLDFALSKDYRTKEIGEQLSLLEYLDFKLKSGLYEIYVTYAGYESNRCIVNIHNASKQTLFYPEYFNNLKLGWQLDINYEYMPLLYKGSSSVVIDVPSEIYHYPDSDSATILPLCCTSHYPTRDDIVKKGALVEIFIKQFETQKIYKGSVDFSERNAYGDKVDTKDYYPQNNKEGKALAKTISEDQMCTRAFNINALDFVDMPYKAGEYEVWVKRAGYESNHMKVAIKFFYEK